MPCQKLWGNSVILAPIQIQSNIFVETQFESLETPPNSSWAFYSMPEVINLIDVNQTWFIENVIY